MLLYLELNKSNNFREIFVLFVLSFNPVIDHPTHFDIRKSPHGATDKFSYFVMDLMFPYQDLRSWGK